MAFMINFLFQILSKAKAFRRGLVRVLLVVVYHILRLVKLKILNKHQQR